jgi:hypothetical protein
MIAAYYRVHNTDLARAIHFTQTGLSISMSTGNTRRQAQFAEALAMTKWKMGDYSAARAHAYESHRISKVSGNLLEEATALQVESMCLAALSSQHLPVQ